MHNRKPIILVVSIILVASVLFTGYAASKDNGPPVKPPKDLQPIEELGWFLYFDENLSQPLG